MWVWISIFPRLSSLTGEEASLLLGEGGGSGSPLALQWHKPGRRWGLPSYHSVQFSSVAQACPSLFHPMECSMQSLSSPKFMPSNHLILCRPLFLLPLIFSRIRVFSNESALHIRWPKYWGFSYYISPSNKHPGLISFRMDWLGLLAVQGTHRVFSNTTVQKHQFFGAQLSSQSNSRIHTWLLENHSLH